MITLPDIVVFNSIKQPLMQYLININEIDISEAGNLLLEDKNNIKYISAGAGKANIKIEYKSGSNKKYYFMLSLIIAKIEGKGAGWKVAVVTISTGQKIYISYGIIH